jgi:hypothetical protein
MAIKILPNGQFKWTIQIINGPCSILMEDFDPIFGSFLSKLVNE